MLENSHSPAQLHSLGKLVPGIVLKRNLNNNWYIGNIIEINGGIRQGCLVSALLFILVVEILDIKIRENQLAIKGFTLQNDNVELNATTYTACFKLNLRIENI